MRRFHSYGPVDAEELFREGLGSSRRCRPTGTTGGGSSRAHAACGQLVEPAVVEAVVAATRGQPGLVGWFGELLTETYNPRPHEPITLAS